jgi:outer membrane protein assembly factor BamB
MAGGAVLVVAACIAVVPTAALAVGTWSQFQGDASHTGVAVAGVQAPFQEAWNVDVPSGGPQGRYGLSPPVLAGDTVIAVAPNEVLGVDLATGQRRWSIPRDFGPSVPPAVGQVGGRQLLVYTEGFGEHPPGSSPGPSATETPSGATSASPTGSASRSPASSASPAAGTPPGAFDSHLVAIDVSTRSPAWDPVQLNQVSRTGVTLVGNEAFVGDTAGTIYAVDLSTGRITWTAKTGGSVDTPIAASGGRIFVSVQGSSSTLAAIVALNVSDGSQAWRYEAPREVLASAPSVGGGSVLVGLAGVSSTVVRALDEGNGSELWSARVTTTLTPIGAPAVAPGVVVAQDVNSQVYRFDPRNGVSAWDYALNEPAIRTAPVLSGSQVLVASDDGRLAALDGRTGELVWRSPPQGGLLRNPLVTSDLVVLVRGGVRPGLVAFSHDAAGSLVRLASPTTVDPVRLLGGFVAAAAPLAAILLLVGRWLAERAGPAFAGAQDPSAEDAWEREEGDAEDGGDTSHARSEDDG